MWDSGDVDKDMVMLTLTKRVTLFHLSETIPIVATLLENITLQNPWDTYLGDCSVVDEYLADKPVRSAWLPAHYLNVFLRAVGQPAFVNNPILGAAIFASLFVKEWQVGTGCLLGGSIATLTELVGAVPFNEGTTFCNLLVTEELKCHY